MADKQPYMMVGLGDYNAEQNSWYANGNTNTEGSKIDILTVSFDFNQIINKPTHILNNSSSCIDLIFTSQQNLLIESGVHSSVHPNCHHQITYVKFNLNVIYTPPTKERCDTTNQRILTAFNTQLAILTGKKHFIMLM